MDSNRYPTLVAGRFNLDAALNLCIIICSLIFVAGGFVYLQPASQPLPGDVSPTSMERVIAIEQARQSGQKTFTYTTNFIPGIGQIGDAEAYKKSLGLTAPVD